MTSLLLVTMVEKCVSSFVSKPELLVATTAGNVGQPEPALSFDGDSTGYVVHSSVL